ncbi:MAG TPA: alcohol dehydrogenase [Stellaceae bacterium]|nr:alcohol dehydrogenase [Stellaceae bacterium]
MRSYDVARFGAPLELFERPTPKPAGAEVLVRTLAAGVCHSDLHLWEGEYDLGGGKKLHVKDRGITPPFTMGHEIVGEVVALGPEATGAKVGDRRLVHPWIGCGTCAVCRRGDEHHCASPRFLGVQKPGGYSDHVLVPHPRYLVEFGALSPEQAAPFACSGVTAYGALSKFAPSLIKSEPVVVIGAGGLGLMALSVLQAMGGAGAVVVDIDAKKREAATKAGALAVVDSGTADAVKAIQAATKGGAHAVIDFVGSSTTARIGTDALAKGGKYVIVGLFGGDLTLSLPMVPWRAISIQGSYTGNLRELKELMTLVATGRVPPVPLTRHPLHEANHALERLKAGQVIGRAVLVP